MHLAKTASLAASIALLLIARAPDAHACGGCLGPPVVQQSEATVVTGHRMVLSVSKDRTTLWDQITYSGQPASFAWVLPIRGKVDIGLSSDALFQNLERLTQVTVRSPVIECPVGPGCSSSRSNAGLASAAGDGSDPQSQSEPPVEVIAEETVGPYETVQLSSKDAGALTQWLDDHGYAIPADIAPVIGAYVSDGFDFLAMKLVPGQGVQAMRPVRVTSPGGGAILPLRMVAAGTGAVTPITLWVVAEGRYEPTNMPSFTIGGSQILWNWDTSSSNYAALKHAAFAASGGKSWLVESAGATGTYALEQPLLSFAASDPANSGYGDPAAGVSAEDEAAADVDALTGSFAVSSSIWVTRMHGELSREALADDLSLGASTDQSFVSSQLRAKLAIGTPPPCPAPTPCAGSPFRPFGSSGGLQGSGTAACAMTGEGGAPLVLGGALVAMAIAVERRRRGGREARPAQRRSTAKTT